MPCWLLTLQEETLLCVKDELYCATLHEMQSVFEEKKKEKNYMTLLHPQEILHSANNKCPPSQYWLQVKRKSISNVVQQYHAWDHLTWDNTRRQRGLYLNSVVTG